MGEQQINIEFSVNNNKFIDDDEFMNDKDLNRKNSNEYTSPSKENNNDKHKIDLQNYNISNKKPSFDTLIINMDGITDVTTDRTIEGKTSESRDQNDSETSPEKKNIIEPVETPDTLLTLKKIGSKTFRTHIMKDYIRPRMEKDIKESFLWRHKWAKISNIFFSFSEILCIIQTVMAFTASSYDLKLISFLAGMLGLLCISFNRFATYARNASSEKTSQLNEVLGTIGIKDLVPDLMDLDLIADNVRRGSKFN
jgi:hypothetical protein